MFSFVTKPEHEARSMEYVLGRKDFLLPDNKHINIHELLLSVGWTEQEISLIAFLCRVHSCFGYSVGMQASSAQFVGSLDESRLFEDYTKSVKSTILDAAKETHLFPDSMRMEVPEFIRLLRLSCLMAAADSFGLEPVECESSLFDGLPKTSLLAIEGIGSLYKALGYDTVYKQARETLLKWGLDGGPKVI